MLICLLAVAVLGAIGLDKERQHENCEGLNAVTNQNYSIHSRYIGHVGGAINLTIANMGKEYCMHIFNISNMSKVINHTQCTNKDISAHGDYKNARNKVGIRYELVATCPLWFAFLVALMNGKSHSKHYYSMRRARVRQNIYLGAVGNCGFDPRNGGHTIYISNRFVAMFLHCIINNYQQDEHITIWIEEKYQHITLWKGAKTQGESLINQYIKTLVKSLMCFCKLSMRAAVAAGCRVGLVCYSSSMVSPTQPKDWVPPFDINMEVHIQTPNGTFTIGGLNPFVPIMDIRARLAQLWGVAHDDYYICYQGRILDGDKCLYECRIKKGAILYANLRIRGGTVSPSESEASDTASLRDLLEESPVKDAPRVREWHKKQTQRKLDAAIAEKEAELKKLQKKRSNVRSRNADGTFAATRTPMRVRLDADDYHETENKQVSDSGPGRQYGIYLGSAAIPVDSFTPPSTAASLVERVACVSEWFVKVEAWYASSYEGAPDAWALAKSVVDEHYNDWLRLSHEPGLRNKLSVVDYEEGSNVEAHDAWYRRSHGRLLKALPSDMAHRLGNKLLLLQLNAPGKVLSPFMKTCAILAFVRKEHDVKDGNERIALQRHLEHPINVVAKVEGVKYEAELERYAIFLQVVAQVHSVVCDRVALGITKLHDHVIAQLSEAEKAKLQRYYDEHGIDDLANVDVSNAAGYIGACAGVCGCSERIRSKVCKQPAARVADAQYVPLSQRECFVCKKKLDTHPKTAQFPLGKWCTPPNGDGASKA